MAKETRKGKVETIFCTECLRQTKHTLLETYDTHWSDEEADMMAGATHDFLKCNGCESATLRITSWHSEAPGERSVTFFPPRGTQETVRAPKSFEEITYGGRLDSVYRQTLSAFNQKLLTLAGGGVRL